MKSDNGYTDFELLPKLRGREEVSFICRKTHVSKSEGYSEFHTIHGISSLEAGCTVNGAGSTKTTSVEADEKPCGESSQKPTRSY